MILPTEPGATREPATLFCDESGFGAPNVDQGRRLWVSAICVPESRQPELTSLDLKSSKKDARKKIAEAISRLLPGDPPILGAVGYIDTSAPRLEAFYSSTTKFRNRDYRGPSLLWSTTVTACCAAVIAQLHRIRSPYSPLLICHDRMTLKPTQRQDLREVVESLIPSITRELAAGITGRRLPYPELLPRITLCSGSRCFRPGLALADHFATASRSAWMRGDKLPAVHGIMRDYDLTPAAVANLEDPSTPANDAE